MTNRERSLLCALVWTLAVCLTAYRLAGTMAGYVEMSQAEKALATLSVQTGVGEAKPGSPAKGKDSNALKCKGRDASMNVRSSLESRGIAVRELNVIVGQGGITVDCSFEGLVMDVLKALSALDADEGAGTITAVSLRRKSAGRLSGGLSAEDSLE